MEKNPIIVLIFTGFPFGETKGISSWKQQGFYGEILTGIGGLKVLQVFVNSGI